MMQKFLGAGILPTVLNLKRLSSGWTKLALQVMKRSVCQSPKHRSRLPPPSNCLRPGPKRSLLSRPASSSHRKRLAAPYCKSATTSTNRPTFRFARRHYAPLWTQRLSCPTCSSVKSSCVSTSFKALRGCSIYSACPPRTCQVACSLMTWGLEKRSSCSPSWSGTWNSTQRTSQH
ncbi:hypothetical protein D3C73_778150 [compost metagenome]